MPVFDTPINTNDQSLDRVLANPLPVMLITYSGDLPADFTSALNDVARSNAGKLIITKLNTRENAQSGTRYGSGLHLLTLKNGAEQLRLDDPTADQIQAAAEHLLGRGPAPKSAPKAESSTNGSTSQNGSAHPITVSESTFEQQVLQSNEPVLVDFWAPWCGPCRMVAPTLEKLSKEFAGKVKIAKVNIDENPGIAQRYQVMSIPMMMMFVGGKASQKIVGAHPEGNIRQLINSSLR